eukprot:1193752-Prorocentrum_minimum.AAC.1
MSTLLRCASSTWAAVRIIDVGRGAPADIDSNLRIWARLRAAGKLREEEVAIHGGQVRMRVRE